MFKCTYFSLAICLTISLANWAGNCLAADKPFTHPGILHSRAELDFVKAKVAVEQEPWKSAWEELRSHSISSLDWKPKPAANVVRGAYNNLGHDVPYESYRSHDGRYNYTSISGTQSHCKDPHGLVHG